MFKNTSFPGLIGRTVMALVVMFAAAQSMTAQAQPGGDRTRTHQLDAGLLPEARTVNVHLPAGYEDRGNNARYPVLYVLNRDENFALAAMTVDFLADKGNIPPMIVVGLPHEGFASRDYTASESGAETDGARRYLAALEAEVLPFVESRYRTAPSRLLAGHSLGGLFTTYALVNRPDLFNGYIALSPSYHHGRDLIGQMADFLSTGSIGHARALYMDLGSDEYFRIRDAYDEMESVIERGQTGDLRVQINRSANTSHRSMALTGLYGGLTTMFAGYNLSEPQIRVQRHDGVIAHYGRMSREFGIELMPDRGDLEFFASYYADETRGDDADIAADGASLLSHFYGE